MPITAKNQNFEQENNVLVGTWTSYITKGIHSPALNVYIFHSDGAYVKITTVLLPQDQITGDQMISTTSYSVNGVYKVEGKSVLFSTGGEKSSWTFELDGDALFFTNVEGEEVSIVLLTRVKSSTTKGTKGDTH
jgi:hypothetical protein